VKQHIVLASSEKTFLLLNQSCCKQSQFHSNPQSETPSSLNHSSSHDLINSSPGWQILSHLIRILEASMRSLFQGLVIKHICYFIVKVIPSLSEHRLLKFHISCQLTKIIIQKYLFFRKTFFSPQKKVKIMKYFPSLQRKNIQMLNLHGLYTHFCCCLGLEGCSFWSLKYG